MHKSYRLILEDSGSTDHAFNQHRLILKDSGSKDHVLNQHRLILKDSGRYPAGIARGLGLNGNISTRKQWVPVKADLFLLTDVDLEL